MLHTLEKDQTAPYILNIMQTIRDLSMLVVKAAMERLLISVVLLPIMAVVVEEEPTILASVQLCLLKEG